MCNLKSLEKFAAIHELIENVSVFHDVHNLHAFEEEVVRRERVQSTGIGRGVAVAHGVCRDARNIILGLGISEKGIEFESIDKKPVHLLFLIANPPNCEEEYLILLSALVKLVRNNGFRKRLLEASSTEKVQSILNTAFCRQAAKEKRAYGYTS